MRGGKPGYYPSLKEADGIPHPVPFDLFNPFGLLPEQTEAQKALHIPPIFLLYPPIYFPYISPDLPLGLPPEQTEAQEGRARARA
jgi:hypothetical protein